MNKSREAPKPYPKFPKSTQEFRDHLDEERLMGYEDGIQDGKVQERLHAERTYTEQEKLIHRCAAEVAIDCLETVRYRLDIRDCAAPNNLNQAQTETTQALAKMMYSTFKILEMIK